MVKDDEEDQSSGSEAGVALNSAPHVLPRQGHPEESAATQDLDPVSVDRRPGLTGTTPVTGSVPMSKNQQKRLKRKQQWEEGRDDRKAKRKEKSKQKKERKRATLSDQIDESEDKIEVDGESVEATTTNPSNVKNGAPRLLRLPLATQLPVTFVIDCQFDALMTDNEIMSLGSQLTRSYSDNRKAQFRAHVAISSFGDRLRDRFDGILEGHHASWKGVRFLEQDFVAAAEQAATWMREPGGGVVAGALLREPRDPAAGEETTAKTELESAGRGEIVYLSSESPDTLTKLKPYGTYIIGGLVDRNRHKGICYKRAMDRGIRTAKLPIGDYMQMRSRAVLATNHVVEIMLKWLEIGNWGEAFLDVIPKRKGGVLKGKGEDTGSAGDEEEVVKGTEETNGSVVQKDTGVEDGAGNEEIDKVSQGSIGDEKLKRTFEESAEQNGDTKRFKHEQYEDNQPSKDEQNDNTKPLNDEEIMHDKHERKEETEQLQKEPTP